VILINRIVRFFFDDSGVFHKTESSGYFVYAGYVFFNMNDSDSAKRKYKKALSELKKSVDLEGEFKASSLNAKHKRSLHNSVREFDSLSIAVKLDRVYDHIINDKKSRGRYKDYILKRGIKSKLSEALKYERINADDDINLFIYIDEQQTATNGYYSLEASIKEELQYGIHNFDYGITHNRILNGAINVKVEYCDSKSNYLIQASDILANRVRASYFNNNQKLREIPNHSILTFP